MSKANVSGWRFSPGELIYWRQQLWWMTESELIELSRYIKRGDEFSPPFCLDCWKFHSPNERNGVWFNYREKKYHGSEDKIQNYLKQHLFIWSLHELAQNFDKAVLKRMAGK